MQKCKRCTHRILYSLDLRGMEALMVYLFTEVGRALMSVSSKTKSHKHTQKGTFPNPHKIHVYLHASAKKNKCGKKAA